MAANWLRQEPLLPSTTVYIDSKLGLVDTGKSSVVMVISPLIALMVDQVKSLRSRGVKCSILTSSSCGDIDKDTWFS